MLLAIDVGNTNTTIGVFRDDALVQSWRIHTDLERTVDELGATLVQYLRPFFRQ